MIFLVRTLFNAYNFVVELRVGLDKVTIMYEANAKIKSQCLKYF